MIYKVQQSLIKNPELYSKIVQEEEEEKLALEKNHLHSIEEKSNIGIILLKKISVDPVSLEKCKSLKKSKMGQNEFCNKIAYLGHVLSTAWQGESVSGIMIDRFISSLSCSLVTQCFSKMLQVFRKSNKFRIEGKKSFESLTELVLIILSKCSNFYQTTVPLEIINICGTYYLKKEPGSPKIYLLQGIKKHNLFKNFKFWEAALLSLVNSSKEDFDFHDRRHSIEISLVNENYKSKISRTFMAIAMHMMDLDCNKEMVYRLFGVYFNKYKLEDKFLVELNQFLASFSTPDDADLPPVSSPEPPRGPRRGSSSGFSMLGIDGLMKKTIGIFKGQLKI